MVNFSFSKDSAKKRAISILIADWFLFLIVISISFILSLYFLCVGFLSDKEALTMGIPLLGVVLILSIAFCFEYIKRKKQIESIHEKNSPDGNLDYELTKQGDIIYMLCKQTNTVVKFSIKDLKHVHTIGYYIIVKLKDRRIICLPKMKEISVLLK